MDIPEYNPPPKRHQAIGWSAALIGLFLLNIAAESFIGDKPHAVGWIPLVVGFALLFFAIQRAAR